MTRAGWIVIAAITLVRLIAAFRLPLTGDEAYYWEWSRRLAAGYIDHPPAVAWVIAAFSWLGSGAGFIRLGFVLCGAVAAAALGDCAALFAENRRAGDAAAILLSLAPLCSVAFTTASPDGPYLMFWCLTLLFAARAMRSAAAVDFALLGAALGGALLSRIFAFALGAGLAGFALGRAGRGLRRGDWLIAFGIAAVLFAPYLAWNATHDWVSFSFALIHRNDESSRPFSVTRLLNLYLGWLAAFSPGIFAAVCAVAVRRDPKSALLAWTALPLLIVLTALALFRDVEVYWALGPFASLCAMSGVAYPQLRERTRAIWGAIAVVPATLLLALVFAIAYSPGPIFRFVAGEIGLRMKATGPFEIFAFEPLAADVARLASGSDTIVMTDGYGLSSVLDFYRGLTPVVIGYAWQGRESLGWYPSSMRPKRALFVDKEALSERPDFAGRLRMACVRVKDGGVYHYGYAGAPPRAFYLTWCEGVVPNGIAILRWQSS